MSRSSNVTRRLNDFDSHVPCGWETDRLEELGEIPLFLRKLARLLLEADYAGPDIDSIHQALSLILHERIPVGPTNLLYQITPARFQIAVRCPALHSIPETPVEGKALLKRLSSIQYTKDGECVILRKDRSPSADHDGEGKQCESC